MKNLYLSAVAVLLLCNMLTAVSQDYHVRIGFIGNSITFGAGLTDPKTECYPAQLGLLLQEKYGDTCVLSNFAISSRTMLKHGDFPIWNDAEFRNAWKFAPDILLICLGTNDSKPQNWDLYGHEFYDDYQSMIDTFRVRNAHVKFLVCHPCPAYQEVWGIRDSVITHGVIPAIDSIIGYSGATLVDFYTPLIDSVALFPDYIHPDYRGSGAMARIVFNTMLKSDIVHTADTGLTFVTNLVTDTKFLAAGDSATLTWTTVNADAAFLNGEPVPVNGNCKVSPAETMVYSLSAMGKLGKDSMSIEQTVYHPVLTRLMISPRTKTINEGDTVTLKVTFIDQMNKVMPDAGITVTFAMLEGDGSLINTTASTVDFVAGNAGKAVVDASVDTIHVKSTLTILPSETGTGIYIRNNGSEVFPNPAGDILFVRLESNGHAAVHIHLYDMTGTQVLSESCNVTTAGMQTIAVKIKDIGPGVYLYRVSYAGKSSAGRLVVKR